MIRVYDMTDGYARLDEAPECRKNPPATRPLCAPGITEPGLALITPTPRRRPSPVLWATPRRRD